MTGNQAFLDLPKRVAETRGRRQAERERYAPQQMAMIGRDMPPTGGTA